MFKIVISGGFVTEFNDSSQDWSGETFYKSVSLTSSNFSTLSLENIIQHLKATAYVDLAEGDLFLDNGIEGQFSVVENSEGFQDDKGRYLCTYSFMVIPVAEPINLEALLLGGAA